MPRGIAECDRKANGATLAVDFVLRHRHAAIPCRISFDTLRRLAHEAVDSPTKAEQIFDRHRQDIEIAALACYAAGDFVDGVVMIDEDKLEPGTQSAPPKRP